MWTFTQTGFYSAVAYDRDRDGLRLPLPAGAGPDDLLLVRTRAKSDLLGLLEALELPGSRAASSPSADYPWRAVLTRSEWSSFLERETERLDYPNFKSRVMATAGRDRHDAYVRVWAALHALEDRAEAS